MNNTDDRFIRQRPIFGDEGSEIISKLSMSIVGVGSNGSALALICTLSGIKNQTLIDFDRIELTNLHRFALGGGENSIGKLKVDVAKRRIMEIDRTSKCSTIPYSVMEDRDEIREALRSSHVIGSCVDNVEARMFLQSVCKGKIILDLGSGGLMRDGKLRVLGSRVSLYIPGGACLYCQTLDEEGMDQSQISFITPNLIAACLGLEMLLSYITGYGRKVNFAVYDSINHTLKTLPIVPREDCPYCGSGKDDSAIEK